MLDCNGPGLAALSVAWGIPQVCTVSRCVARALLLLAVHPALAVFRDVVSKLGMLFGA